jgi:hypothetical protein
MGTTQLNEIELISGFENTNQFTLNLIDTIEPYRDRDKL